MTMEIQKMEKWKNLLYLSIINIGKISKKYTKNEIKYKNLVVSCEIKKKIKIKLN